MRNKPRILFELKKIASQRVFVLVAILIVIACAVSSAFYSPPGESVQIPNNYGAKYTSDLERAIMYAENNIADYGIDGENYIVRYNRNVTDLYSNMIQIAVPENVSGYGELILSYGQPIWVLLLALLVGSTCSLCENDTGMNAIHIISKGQRRTYRSKIWLLLLSAFASSVVILVVNALIIGIRFDFVGLNAPLISIPAFELCPFNIRVWQYIGMMLLWNALLAFFVSLFSALIGKQSGSYIITFLLGLVLGGFLLSKQFDINGMFQRYQAFNLFGTPVLTLLVLLVCLLVLILALAMIMTYMPMQMGNLHFIHSFENAVRSLFKKRITTAKETKRRQYTRKGMLSYELKKLLITSGMVILVACALLAKGYVSLTNYSDEKISANLYEQEYYRVVSELSGEITSEKTDLVFQKLSESNHVISQREQMRERVQSELITREEYNAYITRLDAAYLDNAVYTRIDNQIKHIQSNNYENAQILYETGWTKLLNQNTHALLLLTLTFLFAGAYAQEYKNGTIALVSTTKKGVHALHKTKFKAVALLTVFIWIVFTLLSFISVLTAFPLDGFSVSTLSLSEVDSHSLDIPIGLHFALNKLMSVVFCTCFGLATCFASKQLKKTYFVLPLMLVVALLTI